MLSAASGQGNISEAIALTALADGAIWCGVDLPDGNGLRRMAQKVDGSLGDDELIFLEARLPAGERGVLELLGGRRGIVVQPLPGDRVAVIAPIPDASTGVALGELILVTGSPLSDDAEQAIEHVARRMGDLLEAIRPSASQPSWETLVDFAGAFEHAPYAIVCTDQAGQLLMANAACEEMTGYSRMELLRMHSDDLIADRFHEGIRSLRRRFQHAGKSPRAQIGPYRMVGRRRNGDEFPVDVTSSAHVTGRGTIAVHVIRDVQRTEDPTPARETVDEREGLV